MALTISKHTVEELERASLYEVMNHEGFRPKSASALQYSYLCPFHDDKAPSFRVDTKPRKVGDLMGWRCHGCGKQGFGAISLWAELKGLDLQKDFVEICKGLAKHLNIIIVKEDGSEEWVNNMFHRAVEVTDEYGCFEEAEFRVETEDLKDEDVRALGCFNMNVMEDGRNGQEEDGEEMMFGKEKKYSWGKDYEESWCGSNFDLKRVTDDFSYYAVKNCIVPVQGSQKVWRIESSKDYPIGVFVYANEDGEPYYKKYEPLNIKKEHRFNWWGAKPEGMNRMLWGDRTFMALHSGDGYKNAPLTEIGAVSNSNRLSGTVPVSKSSIFVPVPEMDKEHPMVLCEYEREDGTTEKVWKMERLLICSGPKDGMNAYYHSSCHVCWALSERTPITDAMIYRLSRIAKEIYICYDSDRTGVERMNNAALQHLELKPVFLPTDLGKVISPRTKKPCKDLTEYLCYYPTRRGRRKNDMFEGLLHNARSMKFWREVGARKNVGGKREAVVKYEILPDAVAQFAPARGIYQYNPKLYDENEQLGKFYMKVVEQKATMIDDKDIVQMVRQDMMEYLLDNYRYNNQELRNTIVTSRRMIPDVMQEIAAKDISFMSWNKEEVFFKFRNTAVKVTADGIEKKAYRELDFLVNEKAVVNRDFTFDGEGFFEIEYNAAYMNTVDADHEERMRKCHSEDDKRIEMKRWKDVCELWRWKLNRLKPLEEWPPAFRVLYNSGRVHWRTEESGIPLTETERQTQDLHFINKAMAIGYMLDPYRDPTRIQIIVSTDYNQYILGKPCGRNLKSFVGSQLLPLVTNGHIVGGKDVKTKAEKFAENFAGYELTEHSYMYLDDLKTDIDVEMLFNVGFMVSKRKLYHDVVQITDQWVPKIMISTNNNQTFDMSSGSISERVWLTYHSDYYHAASDKEEARSPMTEFRRQIIKEITDEELQQTMYGLLYCCQCWKKANRDHYEYAIVRPPLSSKEKLEQLQRDLTIKDAYFIPWIQEWFTKDCHFNRPISVREMYLQYLVAKKCHEEGILPSDITDISKSSVSKQMGVFKQSVQTYCEHLPYKQRIVVNPVESFDKLEVNGYGSYLRCVGWNSQTRDGMDDIYDLTKPRLRDSGQRTSVCMYFFRIDQIPRIEDVRGASMTDEEGWT